VSTNRILIVDDDTSLLTAITGALALRMPNVAVETCASALEAMEKVTEADYDAVVTDIKMPGVDGLALLKEIRARAPELPTLLITGHGEHDLAVQALRGGAFDFIQKPIDRDYFVASVSRAIRVREMDRLLQSQRRALENHAVELEQAVHLRTEQLREADRRKDEFLAMLAHELRNPLAPIRSGLELLAMERDGHQETIRLMQEQVRHLVRLVDDLLDVSRIMKGKIELRKERLDLSMLIHRCVEAMETPPRDDQHELDVSLPHEPIWLYADPVRIAQVIDNLLNNAFKYTETPGRIELAAGTQNGEAYIRVADTGVGIEPEFLPSVFEPFAQSSRSLDRAKGGVGIGLTLVQRLVELHQGTVSAHSEGRGRGSTFIVHLPVCHAAPPTETKVDAPGVAPDRRILIVDDHIGAVRMLSLLLAKLGDHEIETAYDGPSALARIEQIHPEIVLLDIGLPGMNGYEVARTLRSKREFDDVLLVALTGYGQEEDRQRARQAGFDRHLVKPVETSKLKELLVEFRSPVH
jgi:signal transduction histidine kinase